jgi:hypothetical protein
MVIDPMTAIAIISVIASASYSISQAKKMKSDAKKAAEARRGFEIPTEGESAFCPIVYGRAKIGGSRVFHQTKSSFIFVTPNSANEFHTGIPMNQIRPVTFNLQVTPGAPGFQDPDYPFVDENEERFPGAPYERWQDTYIEYNEQ